jgi:DNA polymerase sigma
MMLLRVGRLNPSQKRLFPFGQVQSCRNLGSRRSKANEAQRADRSRNLVFVNHHDHEEPTKKYFRKNRQPRRQPEPPPPWFKDDTLSRCIEVEHFLAYVSLRSDEESSRRQAHADIEALVSWKWPGSQLKVFGSYAKGGRAGAHIYSSDIDLELSNVPGYRLGEDEDDEAESFALKRKVVTALGELLSRTSWCSNMVLIKNAQVPIAAFNHVSGVAVDVAVDVTVGDARISAPIASLDDLDWSGHLPALVSILKVFLSQRDLHKVASGGLGSYRLYVLVAAFLDNRADICGVSHDKSSAGALLDFFKWASHSKNLDYGTVVECRGHVFRIPHSARLSSVCYRPASTKT